MNYLKIFFLLFISSQIFAQNASEKIIEQLEIFSTASFNNWKYSTDLSLSAEKISKLDYDDSAWKNLQLDERIYPDSCWFRKIIELPKFIATEEVRGTINFLVTVDDYGYMFINGEKKGRFDWDGKFLLTENAQAGQKFVLVIKAVNTGGPMRLIRAQLDFGDSNSVKTKIMDFITSLRVGKKLLSFDTYQTNSRVKIDPKIDKSKIDRNEKIKLNDLFEKAVAKIDINALKNGEQKNFLSSLDKARKELKPVSEFAKRFTIHFTANAHIDAAWLWRKKETVDVCYHTFSSVMNMYAARGDETRNFAYSQSQAAFYEWMKDLYPDLFEQIKEKVRKGSWEIVGGMWVEPDCNLPDGISWSRQLLYGQKFFENNLGKRAKIGWNPDSFGYNWNLPMFLLNAGIDVFITQKIGWNDTNVFPYRVFWWEAPNGSRILTYFPFDYVNDISKPVGLVDWLRQFEANTGFTDMMVLFGVGNHGGGPSIEMMKRIDKLAQLDIYPKVRFGTADEYLSWLKKQDLKNIPVWKDELYLEYHRGTMTTQSDIKKSNRESEVLLSNAEKFSSVANQFGMLYPQDDLKDAWKIVLFNQFHDILPGSSINSVYLDAKKDYAEAKKIGENVLANSLNKITSEINTESIQNGKPLVVFNPLSWSRNDIVKIVIPNDESNYKIFDLSGKEIPSQIISKSRFERELLFFAENVPSLGYKTFKLVDAGKASDSQKKQSLVNLALNNLNNIPPQMIELAMENKFFKLNIDAKTGWINQIFDKQLNKNLLTSAGNKLLILEDKPTAWDAWNIGLTGVEFPYKFRKIELIEDGDVVTVLRAYFDYLKPGTVKEFPTEDFPNSFFTQDIILYKNLDRVDFKLNAEWFESKTMLKVAFPVNVQDTIATFEIPFGTIKRSTTLKAAADKGKWETPAMRWADLSEKDFGISLLNKSKYGYDIKGNVMRLSLLRSPKWPDEMADMGFHEIEYSLFPHSGSPEEANIVRKGYEYNNPLIGIVTNVHAGQIPLEKSFCSIENENVVLASLKKSEDGKSFVYQFYETRGKDTLAKISFDKAPVRIELTNFLEDEGEPMKFRGNTFEIKILKNSVVTLKVDF
ncbi:MAG: alpha-mannosidase [Ignavibacteriales bacterium]